MYFQVPSPCRRKVDRDNKIKNALEELTMHSTSNKSIALFMCTYIGKYMSIGVRYRIQRKFMWKIHTASNKSTSRLSPQTIIISSIKIQLDLYMYLKSTYLQVEIEFLISVRIVKYGITTVAVVRNVRS